MKRLIHSMKHESFVSAVAIVKDHAGIMQRFVDEISRVLSAEYSNYEIVLIDNGSRDGMASALRPILAATPCVRYIPLNAEADEQIAVLAGLDAAIGDFVVTLHPDFDPVERIPDVIRQCRDGHDVVIGIAEGAQPRGLPHRVFRGIYFALARRILNVELTAGETGFRGLSRHAVNSLTRLRSRRRHFVVVANETGLSKSHFRYEQVSRSGAAPSASLSKSARAAASVLVHNSLVPLRFATACGLLGSLLSFLYSVYVVVVYLFKSDVMPGWTTLSLTLSGLFFIAFVILSLLGEYLGRVLEESTDRPLYFAREEQSSYLMLADPQRRNVTESALGNGSGRDDER